MLRRCASVITWGLVLLALSSPAFAQGGRAEISGTVYDQDKAVMPGVNITATSQDTGLVRTTVTSGDGRFVIATLVPGLYTVQAELQGFQSATQSDLRLNVGQELTLNLTLQLAGIAENLTITAAAPIVEVTTNRIGTNITNAEIDSLPSAGRSQLSLMQMVPGLVPNLNPGSFEGGQYNANGQATSANVFLVDGAYNNDDRRGGSQGTQANVTLDTMAEYQVLTHQYSAEYGGGSGVVVNSVTRSGTNRLSGRAFEYYKDEKLDQRDFFSERDDIPKADYGSNVFGGSLGGPFVQNKAFWFFNVERTLRKDSAVIVFPPDAAPLAVSYSDTQDFTVLNHFMRGDFQLTNNHNFSARWLRGVELTEKDSLVGSERTPDNWVHENDSGDQVISLSFTSVLGNHATNEVKWGHVRENLLQGPSFWFDEDWKFIGLNGRDQFEVGAPPQNTHPDFQAGTATTYNADLIRSYTIDDSFTYLKPGWHGDHTFKIGAGWSRNSADPQTTAANLLGTYSFPTNANFDPADPRTYPWRFQIRLLGQSEFPQSDWRTNFYIQDKWTLNPNVTLNLGVRYDYQHMTPRTKNAIAPRLGIALDPKGTGNTVIRAGFGKFYNYPTISIIQTLQSSAVISPTFVYDTQQQASPAVTGVAPALVCLNPTGSNGLATISPACRTFLQGQRDLVNAGGFINNAPTIDGDRRLPYLWAFSAGVKQQLVSDLAVSVDYVGNRGRDQTTLLDINVSGYNAQGRVIRPQAAGFDPNGVLIPPQARATNFIRVSQYFTDSRFDTDFNSLEIALEKRPSNRWSGRVAYTLAYGNDVGGITDDLNPRADYGRSGTDNRHALAMSANIDVWKGLGAGFVFRTYSGYPITETIGSDRNGNGVNNERPIAGIDDATLPILSPLDASGQAIRNGIEGNKTVLLDGRFQYIWDVRGTEAGLFWELYNLLNHDNFGNPTGTRTSANFRDRIPTSVGARRTMQLGVRVTF